MLELPYYNYYTNRSQFEYEFKSIGRKGVISKVVRFLLQESNIYNLGFGDLDEITGDISDRIVSNNGDSDVVLSTVGQIVFHFTGVMPDAIIFIQGSTAARTRLYQQGINKFLSQITEHFEIFGYYKGQWESFAKRKNYDAFLGRRKKF
jgi:hypothetical protein